MDGWNTTFLLGWPIFRGTVSFREGTLPKINKSPLKIAGENDPLLFKFGVFLGDELLASGMAFLTACPGHSNDLFFDLFAEFLHFWKQTLEMPSV